MENIEDEGYFREEDKRMFEEEMEEMEIKTTPKAAKTHYDHISENLSAYIQRGTPKNYKLIVEDKGFKGNMKKRLTSTQNTERDWVIFAKTFDLNKDELLKLVKFEIDPKILKTDPTYFDSQEINLLQNQSTAFEQALIKVRNEYLYKIDAKRFTKYEVE